MKQFLTAFSTSLVTSVVMISILGFSQIPSPAYGYAFLCEGQTITGFSRQRPSGSNFTITCPDGYQDSDSCGCTPQNAPQWSSGSLSMRVERQGGNGITSSQFVAAAQAAAQSWTDISCSHLLVSASRTFNAASAVRWPFFNNDRQQQEIFFVTSESEWMEATGSAAGGTLGVTSSPYSSGCGNRGFFDSDILINGFVSHGWSQSELEHTILHEMGHAVGLGHPCLTGNLECSNSCTSVMAASGGNFINPQQDDINAVCDLYPGQAGGQGSSCVNNFDCNGALSCISSEGFQYCSSSCAGGAACDSGYRCRMVTGQGDMCVRIGVPAVGESCTAQCEQGAFCISDNGTTSTCRGSCNPSSANCPNLERCVSLTSGGGACFPAGSQQAGEPCGGTVGDCAGGLICLTSNNGSSCYRECNANSPDSCGSGASCLGQTQSGTGYCIDTVPLGFSCADAQCEANAVCVDGGSGYKCFRGCHPNVSNACGNTESCQGLSSGGGACFPTGNAVEGDPCDSISDCSTGLTCIGGRGGIGECLALCDPTAPFCPHGGQSCTGLQGSTDGVCSPAGGSGTCSCDITSGQCDEGCNCDGDCGGTVSCSCDRNLGSCDVGCSCDPLCSGGCTCDVDNTCSEGCLCDPQCSGAGTGNSDSGSCECDQYDFCEADCWCDVECPCACDLTTACDEGCSCDPECMGYVCDAQNNCDFEKKGCVNCNSGALASPWFLLCLVAFWSHKRRRVL